MKITNMRLESYRWPKPNPQSNGKHTYTHDGRNFIFIDTDEGVTGVGLIGGIHTSDAINKAIFEHYKESVIGEDPFCNEKIWDTLWEQFGLIVGDHFLDVFLRWLFGDSRSCSGLASY